LGSVTSRPQALQLFSKVKRIDEALVKYKAVRGQAIECRSYRRVGAVGANQASTHTFDDNYYPIAHASLSLLPIRPAHSALWEVLTDLLSRSQSVLVK
jgi:hypothetical protein